MKALKSIAEVILSIIIVAALCCIGGYEAPTVGAQVWNTFGCMAVVVLCAAVMQLMGSFNKEN